MSTSNTTNNETPTTSASASAVKSRLPNWDWTSRYILPVVGIVTVLFLWENLPVWLDLPRYVLPQLSSVWNALTDPNAIPRYLTNLRVTFTQALVGLVIGSAGGLALGIIFSESRILYRLFYPYIVALQAVPKVAIAPLFVIWFGFGMQSKVFIVVLLTFFPVLVNTLSGMKSVSQEELDLFRANCATRSQIRWKLTLPNAMPQIFSGFELAVTVAMIGSIVGEFVGAQAGLGVMILQAQFSLNIAGVFAILIILAAVGFAMNLTVRRVRRRMLFWMPGERA